MIEVSKMKRYARGANMESSNECEASKLLKLMDEHLLLIDHVDNLSRLEPGLGLCDPVPDLYEKLKYFEMQATFVAATSPEGAMFQVAMLMNILTDIYDNEEDFIKDSYSLHQPLRAAMRLAFSIKDFLSLLSPEASKAKTVLYNMPERFDHRSYTLESEAKFPQQNAECA